MATPGSWLRRSALMYTVGAWTVFGYVIYRASSNMVQRKEEVEEQPLHTRKVASDYELSSYTNISEQGQRETTTYRKPGSSFAVVTTVTSKPDFVPYSVRIYDYVQSFFDNSGGKEE